MQINYKVLYLDYLFAFMQDFRVTPVVRRTTVSPTPVWMEEHVIIDLMTLHAAVPLDTLENSVNMMLIPVNPIPANKEGPV